VRTHLTPLVWLPPLSQRYMRRCVILPYTQHDRSQDGVGWGQIQSRI